MELEWWHCNRCDLTVHVHGDCVPAIEAHHRAKAHGGDPEAMLFTELPCAA